jgi:uncharacterized membrane protein (DUF4010 family)
VALLHLARLAKTVEQSNILAGGILVASAVMFVRVLLVATIINPAMSMLKWPLVAMTAVLVVSAVLYARRVPQMTLEAVRLRNPVELTQALRFGVLLMGIVLVSKGMQEWLGYAGLYLVAAIAGIADVDAITISLSRMSKPGLSLGSASQAVILAATINTVAKGVLVGSLGGKALLSKVITPIIICVLIGALSIWQLAQ